MSGKIDAPQPGSVIGGKYVVEGLLGTGGMGVVLAARHQQLDQKVAIKLLAKEARRHPEVLERFTREARAAAKIQGEHVARVIDVGVLDDGSPFMVMEHLDGRDLSMELKARGPLPPGEIAHWIVEACEAIAQAHAAKIVHRDLKPGNLFLARQPDGHSVVKVLDFGISKVVDPNAPALTKTSSLVGTPYYMSPEQLTAAKSVDTRADIWALGVIMYELLVGAPPFTGESMPEVVASILMNTPAPLETIRDGLPPGLSDAITRCMQTKPEDRYLNIAEVAAAIAPFATARGGHSSGDRTASVQKIQRVLGIVNPYETLPPDTELAPLISNAPPANSKNNSGADASPVAIAATLAMVEKTAVLTSDPPPAATSTSTATATSTASATSPLSTTTNDPPKTQLGVETSIAATTLPPDGKPSRVPLVLALVAVVGLASVIGVMKVGRQTNGVDRELPTNSGKVTATATISALPSASVSATMTTAEPTPSIAPPASTPRTTAVVAVPSTKPSAGAAPPTSVVTATPSHAPSSPPSASAAPKNPLDMGIK